MEVMLTEELSALCAEYEAAYKRLHSQVSGYLHGEAWEHWQRYNEPRYAPNNQTEQRELALCNERRESLRHTLNSTKDERDQLRAELNTIRSVLVKDLDRDKDDTTTPHLAVVAMNSLVRLRAELEAFKQLHPDYRKEAQ